MKSCFFDGELKAVKERNKLTINELQLNFLNSTNFLILQKPTLPQKRRKGNPSAAGNQAGNGLFFCFQQN
jgi:hypothetical protein